MSARRRRRRCFAALLLTLLATMLASPPAWADFGVSAFTVTARNADGTIDELAGSHPFALDVHLAMNRLSLGEPDGVLRTFQIDLPPSLLGNTLTVPRCSLAEFEGSEPRCDGATQIGVIRGTVTGLGLVGFPLYNLAPSPGSGAAFGGALESSRTIQRLGLVGAGASASIRVGGILPADPAVVDIEEEIWGVPADRAHDSQRVCWSPSGQQIEGCSAGVGETPLLSLPASCAEPLRATLTATSYDSPPATAVATAFSRDAGGNPRPLIGCDGVPFEPRLTTTTEAGALAPTGLTVGLEVPQYEGVSQTPAASVAGLEVGLPKGLALNPSAGAWLTGCSAAAIGLESAPGVQPPRFDQNPATCPASARLGSVTLQTPLADHQLSGSIFLAAPAANPFATRYAIYLVIEDAATGTILKVPGRFDADPNDGRLTVTVPDLPQLPFGVLRLDFAGGPRAPLASPPSCGRYASEATFMPSTAPFAPAVTQSSSFAISAGAQGAPCPLPEAGRDAKPSFQAGTEVTRAGSDSPLVIHLSRDDLDQHFGSFDLSLPPGLIANLGSAPLGAAVGSVRVDAGVGPQPVTLGGTVYLGGPYKGSPYSLEMVVPAQVGPFDLGTIVQRAAVSVDPTTAQISVSSDPLPQILGGVPLQVRSVTIDLDRPGFVRNPTSCEPMAITGTATSSLGRSAPVSDRFQVGDCAALRFDPKLSLVFSGALGANGHPAMRAVLRGDPSGAAPVSAGFTLPAGELLDLGHLRGLCPRGAAVTRCPPNSRLGKLRLVSPFVGGIAAGPIYLREPSHGLPDLIAELRSGPLRFVLHGRTATSPGRLAVRFGSLPDIPLSKAVLSLVGGRRGIVVNSHSLCSRPGVATATATAHNGMRRSLSARPHLEGSC